MKEKRIYSPAGFLHPASELFPGILFTCMKLSSFFYRLRHWETWHYLAKYIPLAPAWLWYCLRSRSMWFFTPANPTLTFGGFEGEGKKEMYDQLPEGSYPRSMYLEPGLSLEIARSRTEAEGFIYPFAVKPDVGMMGFLFRQIRNDADFEKYLAHMPVNFIVQEFVHHPLEVSVFYYRYPGQEKGHITGFLKKEFLEVNGNGESTLRQLIENYDRVRFRQEEMYAKHESRLHDIIPAGEIFFLSPALNLSRGGRLVSLEKEKTPALTAIFDAFSHYNGNFFYGRYDIKCSSIEDLKEGKNFTILEFNGAGAEPHHIYGNGHTLLQAYRIVLDHWKALSDIAILNHKRGIPYWGYLRGIRFLKQAKKHFAHLKVLDQTLEL